MWFHLIFVILFVNRVLLNENFSHLIDTGFFYFHICKDTEQALFKKQLGSILPQFTNDGGKKVLDFGSGPGIMSVFFDNYVGVDSDQSRIAMASRAFPEKEFLQIDMITPYGGAMPFENHTFDLILFNDCIHHISNTNFHFILKEIDRILKPDGMILVREPNRNTTWATYLITELLENGDYVRNSQEYMGLFPNYLVMYEKHHYEYIRDYVVLGFKKNPMSDDRILEWSYVGSIRKVMSGAVFLYIILYVLDFIMQIVENKNTIHTTIDSILIISQS
jgi:ubiquinone/menaquinone biosynthesis C-methylase UbiE